MFVFFVMGEFCIYLPLPPYLSQWLVNEHGGEVPVRLRRGSVESKILSLYLTRRPEGVPVQAGGDGLTPVVIPSFRSRPPQTYNYLPPRAGECLLNAIRDRFDLQLWEDMHDFFRVDMDIKDLLYAWLEAHGMEQDERNWLALEKRFRRLRDVYKARSRARSAYSAKKKSD